MTLTDLERRIKDDAVLCVNIHYHGGFEVHVRRDETRGFECAQKRHANLADALKEHFPASLDLDDLLV